MKSLLCSLALLAIGCHGQVWTADDRFSDAERSEIDAAAQAWRDVGQSLEVTYGPVNGFEESGRHIVRTNGRSAALLSDELRTSSTRPGVYRINPLRELIVLIPERTGGAVYRSLQTTAMHEFGHSLGLEHASEPSAIMYHQGNLAMLGCVTKADVQALCALGECGSGARGCDE